MNYEEAIKAHAVASVPNECCGILITEENGELRAVPCTNSSPFPSNSFLISPKEYIPYKERGVIRGMYHSHVTTGPEPSADDKLLSDECGFEYTIYSVAQDRFSKYIPSKYTAPYEGRTFRLGIADCCTLIQDYYRRELHIDLCDFFGTTAGVSKGVPLDEILRIARTNDLRLIDSAPRKHDIYLMSIGVQGRVNHIAVVVQPGIILHQLVNYPSRTELYGESWKRCTLACLRHASQL